MTFDSLLKKHFRNPSDKTIAIVREFWEAGKEENNDTCPICGCDELLCGHNGQGCCTEERE